MFNTKILFKNIANAFKCRIIYCLSFTSLILILIAYYFNNDNLINEHKTSLKSSANLITQDNGCGFIKYSKYRIIGGGEAVPHSQPWIISLRTVNSDTLSDHVCAGAIISDLFVLTAAHCVQDIDASSLAVVVGLHSVNEYQDNQVYYASNVWVHEDYTGPGAQQIDNDIAIIKLSNNIIFSDTVSFVCLPIDGDDDLIESFVEFYGWGDTSDLSYPEYLQTTQLKIINEDSICQENGQNLNDLFCTIGSDGSNICFGDSGGPLLSLKDNKWTQYGIASFVYTSSDDNGRPKCSANKPSYFTRVAKYIDWINDKLAM